MTTTIALMLPWLIAFLLLFVGRTRARWPFVLMLCGFAVHMANSILLIVQSSTTITYHIGGWGQHLGISFLIDRPAAMMVAACSIIFACTSIYALGMGITDTRFYGLILIMLASLCGWAMTSDLFNTFVFIELASIAAYALTAFERKRKSFEAAFKYIILGTLGGGLIFASILLIYFSTGELNMALAIPALGSLLPLPRTVIWTILLVGLSIKTGLVPFHMWLADVHSTAPTPASAILSGILVKMSLFSIYRLISFAPEAVWTNHQQWFLLAVGGFSILFGHIMAWFQDDIKRFLAYSTVAHLGYIAMGLSAGAGSYGAPMHMINHAALKATAFLAVGFFAITAGSTRISDFRGLGRRYPLIFATLSLCALGLVGIPPSNGFTSKWILAGDLMQGGLSIYLLVIPIGTVISALYYYRLLSSLLTGPEPSHKPPAARALMQGSLLICTFMILLLSAGAPLVLGLLKGG